MDGEEDELSTVAKAFASNIMIRSMSRNQRALIVNVDLSDPREIYRFLHQRHRGEAMRT